MENTLPFGMTIYGLCVALAALAATMLHAAQRRASKLSGGVDSLTLALCCVPAAYVGARLLYCLVRFNFFFFELGPMSVLDTRMGGFLLYGAAFGAMAAAALVSKRCGVNAADTLDSLAAPGMLAIFICRLAERFTTEGVGTWLENEAYWRFPIAIQNEWGEWQLAVFRLEALLALAILIWLIARRYARGEKIMTALLLYACCQVVCESMRMDGCLKIGFVRISQVISALVIMAVTLIRALRAGECKLAIRRGAIVLLCVAIVGGLEWALDKTEVDNRIIYAVMTAACVALYANGARFERRGLK